MTLYQNTSFSIIGMFFIKKPLPIAPMNILSVPDRKQQIPRSQRSFEMSLKGSGCSFEEATLSNEEIKPAFFSLRGRKSRGFDEVNYDIVKQSFKSLLVSLKYNFDLSLKNGSFPEKMKIARVIPAFKSVNTSLMTNYRPISALSFFSKILERII